MKNYNPLTILMLQFKFIAEEPDCRSSVPQSLAFMGSLVSMLNKPWIPPQRSLAQVSPRLTHLNQQAVAISLLAGVELGFGSCRTPVGQLTLSGCTRL